jgi:hypothetical protein
MMLGGVIFDAAIERSRTYSADVPSYPVETGFKVSDAVLKNPMDIQLRAVISAMPLTHRYKTGLGMASVQQRLNDLRQLFYSGNPITLVTDSGSYSNMVIQSLTIPETSEMRNAAEVSITLRQVLITSGYDIEVYEEPTGINAGSIPTTSGDENFFDKGYLSKDEFNNWFSSIEGGEENKEKVLETKIYNQWSDEINSLLNGQTAPKRG